MLPLLWQLCTLKLASGFLDAYSVDPSTLQNELTALKSQVATMSGQIATLQNTIRTLQGQLSITLFWYSVYVCLYLETKSYMCST